MKHEIVEVLFDSLLQNYQKVLKENQQKEMNLFLIVLIYCTKNVMK